MCKYKISDILTIVPEKRLRLVRLCGCGQEVGHKIVDGTPIHFVTSLYFRDSLALVLGGGGGSSLKTAKLLALE